ncbi:MAG: DUF1553 domain-containing protein [Bryobacteraceae bacterium]
MAACAQVYATDEFFESKIRPLLAEKCYNCHSSKARIVFGNVRLDSREAILKGGDSGPVALPGRPDESKLIQAVRYQTVQMPPAGKLSDEEIAALAAWVEAGLPWPKYDAPLPPALESTQKTTAVDHWAWNPVRVTPTPAVRDREWPRDPIDRFTLARLEREQLQPSPPADRRTLLRRLSYDLIGLPPTVQEIDAFERDRSPAALHRQVDRLLASPHFGERWGRHWLDVARYADSGFLNRRFPLSFSYRDWVIDAFNRDLPYDRFVTLQLAADQVNADPPDLAALGFLNLGLNLPRPDDLPDRVDDRIDVVTRGLLGLTVSCARCHDHKYDPIPTADYYALYGVFANTSYTPDPAVIEGATPAGAIPSKFYEQRLQERRRALDDFKQERIEELRAEFRQPAERERYRNGALQARKLPAGRRDATARELNLNLYMLQRWVSHLESGEPADPTEVPLGDFEQVMTEGDSNSIRQLQWQFEQILGDYASRGSRSRVAVVEDVRMIRPAYVFIRGNQNDLGEQVQPCFPTILSGRHRPCFHNGSGRAELAAAILDPSNPTAARVIVNRIWLHLFGEGLVRTPSDFGIRGEPPTHPELLDYLAEEFRKDGWSMKRLIRRIVLSATYEQSVSGHAELLEKDPENRLLGRANRRRLDFESLRDSMLAVAGKLDTRIGGPPISLTTIPTDPRRTVYAFLERERPLALLKTFDVADPEQHTPQRHLTTVPQQGLFLLNSPFIAEIASAAARRARRARSDEEFASEIFRLILGRSPDERERREALEFLRRSEPPRMRDDHGSTWEYGAVDLDEITGSVREFRSFRYFTGTAWQAASLLPDVREGAAFLNARGGAPGDGLRNAVARRWVSPVDGEVRITGNLVHRRSQFHQRFGWSNGVRGWIVSSRRGILGQWKLEGTGPIKDVKADDSATAEIDLPRVEVTRGETIDFIVDSLDDYEADDFLWSPRIERLSGDKQEWDARRDFAGPSPAILDVRAQLAQILLLTNEFAFVN